MTEAMPPVMLITCQTCGWSGASDEQHTIDDCEFTLRKRYFHLLDSMGENKLLRALKAVVVATGRAE